MPGEGQGARERAHAGGAHQKAEPAGARVEDVVSHHRRRYTRATLLDAFARAALPRPEVSFFNTLLWPPVAGVRWVRRALGRAEEQRSDFESNRPGLANEVLAGVFAFERHLVPWVSLPFGASLLLIGRR